MIRNPKQEGTDLFDCRPQTGKCPMNCNQCFYNRVSKCSSCHGDGIMDGDGIAYKCQACKGTGVKQAYYVDINKPNIPTVEDVGDGIVRMNTGHDSNLQRDLVIKTAEQYKHFFFNTSIPKFDFPGPVVFTANAAEEWVAHFLDDSEMPSNLMFVRLRVSSSNLDHIAIAVKQWTDSNVPVVLTFMAYYEEDKLPPRWFSKYFERTCVGPAGKANIDCYEWKVRHINSYFCPTKEFKEYVLQRMKRIGGRLVTMCGTPDSNWCRDCRNCETYYWQTVKHMKEKGK